MAFTLKIQSVDKTDKTNSFDFKKMINDCGLRYGSDNEYYVLEEGKQNKSTAILYNPARIGRGIYFECGELASGTITVNYSIPTTGAEIRDFVKVVKEIVSQLGEVTMYCEEEEKEYTLETLEANIDIMIEFSLKNLHVFCNNDEYEQFILTLAMFPWYMDDEKRTLYKKCPNLDDFEQTIHDLQKGDYYFATPSLYRSREDEKVLGVYTLTEELESIFPVDPTDCLNLDDFTIDRGYIRFFIYSENKSLDGVYPYDKFIDFVMEKGAESFDERRILVPPITKDEIMEFIESVKDEKY